MERATFAVVTHSDVLVSVDVVVSVVELVTRAVHVDVVGEVSVVVLVMRDVQVVVVGDVVVEVVKAVNVVESVVVLPKVVSIRTTLPGEVSVPKYANPEGESITADVNPFFPEAAVVAPS